MTKKFLIIQTAYFGDLILTLPLIQVLKNRFKEIEIDLLCIPDTACIAENNPYIHDIITYDKKNTQKGVKFLMQLIKTIRKFRYDVIISPHRSARSSVISFFSKAPLRISFDKSALSFFYNKKEKYENTMHEILRNLSLLKPLNVNITEIQKPELFISNQDKNFVDSLFLKLNIIENDKFVTISPGSVWFTKRFPAEKFSRIIKGLGDYGLKIFLIGGKADFELCESVKYLSGYDKVYNLTDKLTILQSAEVIRRSICLITNDSAPLHIGNAVSTRTIAIFGSTLPEFGFYPYCENDIIFEIKNLRCRPCGIHGRTECHEKHFDCMQKINTEEIISSVVKYL